MPRVKLCAFLRIACRFQEGCKKSFKHVWLVHVRVQSAQKARSTWQRSTFGCAKAPSTVLQSPIHSSTNQRSTGCDESSLTGRCTVALPMEVSLPRNTDLPDACVFACGCGCACVGVRVGGCGGFVCVCVGGCE